MKSLFSILSMASSTLTASNNCSIKGFEIYLKSGSRTPLEEQYSSRRAVQELDNNYAVCYENWGDNIKAIVEKEQACKGTELAFLLKNATDDRIIDQTTTSTDGSPPYFLYGSTEDGLINGKVLPVGKYQLIVYPLKQKTNSTSTIRRKKIADRTKIINFDVVSCLNYQPKNECNECSAEQTCEGYMCVSKGYLRFTLVYAGDDIWDLPIKVIAPMSNTAIGAYSNSLPNGVTKYDRITGGYVDEDYKLGSCRSIGVWVKNIIFPSIDTAPRGIYTIELDNVENCYGISNYPSPKQFELKIYQNEQLVKRYTNADGKRFTFEV